ncbi:Fructose-1 [Abeliophyllum distichum]|uniref:fructose-bisphosphatase n=1 Tax=Abeliophyllum distichum TaxID=126358 RepID=A0ABD1R8M9_9LAMI
MAEAIQTALSWNNIYSISPSNSRPPSLPFGRPTRYSNTPPETVHWPVHATRQSITICKAVGLDEAAKPADTTKKKRSRYEMENLTTWLLRQEQAGNIDAELAVVLSSISLACKQIASLLQRSTIISITGAQGTVNIQGEDQKKLDVISNELFCNCLRSSGRTGIIASEEEDVPVAVEETYSGNYIVVFDPIDGSANIDTALTTGSIFGIYGPDQQCLFNIDDDSTLDQAKEKCIVSVCQPGQQLIGCRTGRIYSFNEGNYDLWDEKLKKYLDDLKKPGPNGKPYSGRYIGCLVGEIHRMLLVGGVYGNPKNKNAKNGNLRLLYECAPMSYLIEQAGGKATDGHQRILDIKPEKIHQRTPIFIGSPEEIEKLEKYLS